MGAVNLSFDFSVNLAATSGGVAKYDVLVQVGSDWETATTANLAGGLLPQCIATAAADANEACPIQTIGIVPGVLSAGLLAFATVDATGRIQRTVSPSASDLIVGIVYANGDFGASFPGHYNSGSGGGGVALTTSDFTQPAQGDTVSLAVDTTAAFVAGQSIGIEDGGYYRVVSITDSSNLVVLNLAFQGNALAGTVITLGSLLSSGGPAFAPIYIDASLPPYSMVADSDRLGGGTNNTPRLQAAIDDIAAGGTIVIPGGDYRLSGSAARPGLAILVDKRVSFVGNGSGAYAYGTTLVCDAGVTGFLTTYELGNAAGQDASWRELSIIAAGHLTTTQACSWDGSTRTATIGAAGDFVNSQVVRIRGAGGLLPLPVTMVVGSTVSGDPTVRLSGYGRFLIGDYLVIGTAYPLRTRVTAVNLLDYTVGLMTDRWAAGAQTLHANKLPTVNNGFAYRVTDAYGTMTGAGPEPIWANAAQLGLTITDEATPGVDGVVWTCVTLQSDPVTLTMARNAATTINDDLVLEGQQIKLGYDVAARIVSGGGTTTLVLDNFGTAGDGSTIPTYPFAGSPTTTDLSIEHHDSGIYVTAICKVSDCTLGSSGKGFRGAGAIVYGYANDAGGPTNSNFTRFQDVWCFNNYHAIQIQGSDANKVKCDQVKSITSRSWSFLDASGLGTVFDNCHADGGRGYLTPATPGTVTTLRDCYTEAGTYAYLGPGTVQINGNVGVGAGGTSYAAANAHGFSVGKSSGGSKYSTHELGLDQNTGWMQWVSEGNPDHPINVRKSTPGGDGPLGYIIWGTTSSTAGHVKYSRVILDHDVANGWVGAEWFPDRLYVGGGLGTGAGGTAIVNAIAGRRLWAWSDSAPTTGTWAVGDRVYNNGASTIAEDYWSCTVAGTPGTWVAIYAAPNGTITNLDPTNPSVVRFSERIVPQLVNGVNETCGLYMRTAYANAGEAGTCGLYIDVPSAQVDTYGSGIKVVSAGHGDAIYVSMVSTDGRGFESARFDYGGGSNYISTYQKDKASGTIDNPAYEALFCSDGSPGSPTIPGGVTPGYGLFYANQASGKAFVARKYGDGNVADGVAMFELVENNLSDVRWAVYNDGATASSAKPAVNTAGNKTRNSPIIRYLGSRYNGGNEFMGGYFQYAFDTPDTIVGSGLRCYTGVLGAESLAFIIRSTGIDFNLGAGITNATTLTGTFVLTPANMQPVSVTPAAFSIDWSLSNTFLKTLAAGANTFTFANATDGGGITIAVTGAASTLSWPSVKWAGGVVPTQTASGTDVYSFVKIGSTIYGAVGPVNAS